MEGPGLAELLRAGIEAVRAGDRARGRRLLLDVVRADPAQETAWLWLAAASALPADQAAALERALALNPDNAPARRRLEELRAGPLTRPEPAVMAVTTAVDPDDDPLLCPFCGLITAEPDERCPHCRRSLLAPAAGPARGSLYGLLIMLGLNLQAGLVQAAVPLAVQSLAEQPDYARLHAGLQQLFTPMDVPVWALALRVALLLALLVLFLNEAGPAHSLAAVGLGLDLAAQALAAWQGWWPLPLLAVNAALSGLAWLLAGAALIGQRLARRRMFTVLDRDLHGAMQFSRRGLEHARRGRLALAVPHLQKAVVLAPKVAAYYKDLAAAQARLGRLEKARLTLQAGQQRAPEDPDFARLLAEVARQRRAHPPRA